MDNIEKLKDLITANHLDTYHREYLFTRLDAYIVVHSEFGGVAYFNLKIMFLRRVNEVYSLRYILPLYLGPEYIIRFCKRLIIVAEDIVCAHLPKGLRISTENTLVLSIDNSPTNLDVSLSPPLSNGTYWYDAEARNPRFTAKLHSTINQANKAEALKVGARLTQMFLLISGIIFQSLASEFSDLVTQSELKFFKLYKNILNIRQI